MKSPKFRVYLKDEALEGLNRAHFERPEIGRMFDVESIDFGLREVEVRTPSELTFSFDEIELMMFTGLCDNNGKEIFESDLVASDEGDPPFVRQVVFSTELNWDLGGSVHSGFYFRGFSNELCYHTHLNDGVVVGNIYENPELLEQK